MNWSARMRLRSLLTRGGPRRPPAQKSSGPIAFARTSFVCLLHSGETLRPCAWIRDGCDGAR